MHTDIDVTAADGVALVSVRVDNGSPVDRRVRLRNRLDGPVLPPRRAGVPESGWDDEGFEGVVPAGSTVALGYAVALSPSTDRDAAPADLDGSPERAVDIEVLGRADESERTADSTPEDAVRSLGSARPPADAVPVSSDPSPTIAESRASESASPEPETFESETFEPTHATTPESDEERPDPVSQSERAAAPDRTGPSEQPTDDEVSAAVGVREARGHETGQSVQSASLATVERRIELAERLDGASVADAAAALSEADFGVEALDSLDADRARLRRLAARATSLADRAADADPDADALRRLA
ncbi:hypothetical protein [Haloferax denitrificans]|uniref:DUF7857 domain-containing protein n=1 Tax=Haloferax denitrificans TaxID=35745 RepID=UPI003C702EED